MVPLEKIVGSVGRYHDFDNQFNTNTHNVDERLKAILKAMRIGKNLPPISLYQIKEDFFILDDCFVDAIDCGIHIFQGKGRAQIIQGGI